MHDWKRPSPSDVIAFARILVNIGALQIAGKTGMSGYTSSPRASAGYAKVIAAARSGDIPGLQQLPLILGTDFGLRHIPEALAIYLDFLDSSLIPSFSNICCQNPEAIDHANRGLYSLFGLQNLLRTVSTSRLPRVERLAAELAAHLVRRLDHIVSWYGFNLNPLSIVNPRAPRARTTAYLEYFALFLAELLRLSPVLANAVWENNGIQDLIVDMWFFQNSDMDPSELTCLSGFKKDDYFLNIAVTNSQIGLCRYSIPSIMAQALLHEDARPRMMAKLLRHRHSNGKGQIDSHFQLARTILSRFEQLQSRVECGQCPAAYAVTCLRFLCNIVTSLTGRETILLLYKAGYTGLATSTLLSISNKGLADESAVLSTRSDHPTLLSAFIVTTFLICQMDPEPPSHGKWRFQSMLDNGVLKIIANAASVWHRSPASLTKAEADRKFDSVVMFELLLPFYVSAVCHPSLVYPTHRAFHGLSREQWDYLNRSCSVAAGDVQEPFPGSNNCHDWAAEFKHKSSQWLNLFKTFRSSWRSMLCDNETSSSVTLGAVRVAFPWFTADRHVRKLIGTADIAMSVSIDDMYLSNRKTMKWILEWSAVLALVHGTFIFFKIFISRLSFKRIPFTEESIDLAEYHPRRFSSEDAIEDAFSRHFLQWTPPRTVERKDGSRIHFRLVEGVFGFGVPNTIALVMLKLCICEPAAGSDDAITTICMDSITRIG
ncbi:hypothetical protein BKA70DRAFT_1564720 [Coprinopsis sp. MPI-PUGE-AT-0042]|nr:hypothetical protein BKA70DRAFT_1564720 [Coprinopsis sp. MPI-PUGE-AT-0042]